MPKDSGIGASSKRREDVRFLTGKGRYTDDINRPGQAYVHFLRSDVAHGKIISIDTSAAAGMPGVVRVFTGDDFKDAGSLPTAWLVTSRDGSPQQEPRHPILAEGVVRHVGEAIAAVVAETLEQAEDAAEAIAFDIEELPAVVDMTAALVEASPKVHESLTSNLCFDWGFIEDNKAKVDAAFETAHHVTTLELVNNRCVANPMEPRCAVAEHDSGTDEYTLWTTSQNPHVIRLMMGAFVLSIPETKLRVIAPDVGGAFGSKIYHYGEEAFVTRAAQLLGRPVKWTSTRSEAFVTDAQGRDHVTKIQLALDADGMFLAFRTETYANMGAYLRLFATVTPTYLHGPAAGGPYRTPLAYVNVKAVFTNTVPVDAYRGAGRPEGDLSAGARRRSGGPRDGHRPGRDPAQELHQARGIPVPDAARRGLRFRRLPRHARQAAGDLGLRRLRDTAQRSPRRAASCAASASRPGSRRAASRPRSSSVSSAPVPASTRARPSGSIRPAASPFSPARTATARGTRPTFAQIVADQLGIDENLIEIVHGDTARIPFGMGTYGSRSAAVGGSAIVKATDKVIAKAKKIAAHLLEASAERYRVRERQVHCRRDRQVDGLGAMSRLPPTCRTTTRLTRLEPGLEETAFYDPTNFTYPAGAYGCEVEVDPDTGHRDGHGFHGCGRFRERHQSDDRRRPSAWRRGAGHRPGAAGKHRL